jgi:glycosidase
MGDVATPLMQNLYGSHDTNRLLSAIINRDKMTMRNWGEYFGWSQVEKNTTYDTRKPYLNEQTVQKLMAVFQITYIGLPMIYYGDEVSMWGANDPDCRKPMLWEDLKYDDERTLPDQTTKRADRVRPDLTMFTFYKKLIAIRKLYPPLNLGGYKTTVVSDEQQIFGFVRTYKDETVHVVLNNSDKIQTVKLDMPKNKSYHDLLSGQNYEAAQMLRPIAIPPKSALILVNTLRSETPK